MKKDFFIFFSLLWMLTSTWQDIHALDGFPKRDERGSLTENFSARGLKLTIESENRRYAVGQDIILQMKIANEGFYPITIYLHKNYLKNFTLIVRGSDGKTLIPRDIFFFRSGQDYNDPFFSNYTATNYEARAITLQPNESMTRPIRLQDVVQMDQVLNQAKKETQKLMVDAYFYPNPEQSSEAFLPSYNSYGIFLDEKNINAPPETGISVDTLRISPLETVYLALSAEKSQMWRNFFKYISLKDIIRDYPNFARNYMQTKDTQKNLVLRDFQEYLMDTGNHKLLKFEMIREKPDENTASVQVRALRKIEGFQREFLYTYYLTRVEKFWLITGIQGQLIK